MKFKKWKKLLKKDKAKACEVLVTLDLKLEESDPIVYVPEDMCRDLMDLHTGAKQPWIKLKRKELIKLGKAIFGVEDEEEGSSSSEAPTKPSGV